MMKRFTVIHESGKRNWSAYVPDLPGCIATGKTRKKVEERIREAIEFHLEGMKARGETIPEPSIEAGTVRVGVD
jgi:predicted RNase H-like HicB family nuclease